MTALTLSPNFNLTSTYFLVAGIAGFNPHVATTGAVAFSRFAIQTDLQYEFSYQQVPQNWTSGYVPQNSYLPDAPADPSNYPGEVYGTEVFELNDNLKKRFVYIAGLQTLNDSAEAQAYRETFGYAPANLPPTVVECDSVTSNVYWSGSVLGDAFSAYTSLVTNGSGLYCASQQEDNAILESLLRADLAGLVDYSRTAIMRTASDFDRAPPGETETFHLLEASQEGFSISIENIFIAGSAIVEDILMYWEGTYDKGLLPGSKFATLFPN
jgi:purine nucleoside permease